MLYFSPPLSQLTHWGRATHIYVTIIGSDNGLSPGRRQAIIWTNVGILLFWPLGRNFSEILIGIQLFSFRKMHSKISSAEWRPFCLGLNELSKLMQLEPWHSFGWQKQKDTNKSNLVTSGSFVKPILTVINWTLSGNKHKESFSVRHYFSVKKICNLQKVG